MKSVCLAVAFFAAAVTAQAPIDFYNGCDTTKNCWGTPAACIQDMVRGLKEIYSYAGMPPLAFTAAIVTVTISATASTAP